MSKLTKLLNNPKLFFINMLNKRKKTKTYQFNKFEKYTHLIHTGENVTGLSHLDLWIPIFQKANINFLIIVRHFELYKEVINKYPSLTVIFAKGNKEIDTYLNQLVFLKACFYPSNTGNNLHLLKFNHFTHIFIGHGDSDKTASAHKYFRVYDENWVAGEAHIDRFRNEGFDFRGLKQVKVGRPNLKETLLISQTPWQKRFNNQLNLLYLSTWEGFFEEQNYTSVYFMDKFFKEITNKKIFSKIGLKIHPGIGRRDTNLLSINNQFKDILSNSEINYNLYDKTTPVEEIIKKYNIFICDISAVISESLAANGPIFVYIPKDKNIKLTKSKMMYEDYCYTFSNLEELNQKIEEVIINKNDYLKENREKAMEYILGKKETLNDEFINKLKEI